MLVWHIIHSYDIVPYAQVLHIAIPQAWIHLSCCYTLFHIWGRHTMVCYHYLCALHTFTLTALYIILPSHSSYCLSFACPSFGINITLMFPCSTYYGSLQPHMKAVHVRVIVFVCRECSSHGRDNHTQIPDPNYQT